MKLRITQFLLAVTLSASVVSVSPALSRVLPSARSRPR